MKSPFCTSCFHSRLPTLALIAGVCALVVAGCQPSGTGMDAGDNQATLTAANLPTSHPANKSKNQSDQNNVAAAADTQAADQSQISAGNEEADNDLPIIEPAAAAALPRQTTRKPFNPVPGTTWQWQLSGQLNTNYDVDVYDIDLFDTPQATISQLHSEGRSVICYFSAGSYEEWRMDASDFPDTVLGKALGDWPGERWIDIRSAKVRELMGVRLNLAKLKGCDAVEPDNVDSYTHDTGFALTAKDQLEYNMWLAKEAHDRGLLVGLKNNLDQIRQLEPHFDFAINEQCSLYAECQALEVFTDAGKAVFRAEYDPTLLEDKILQESLCRVSNRDGHSTLILPRLLNDRFRFDCLRP